ncbi:MAG TPA: hypothetical protein VIA45_06020 [Thermoanaerobaculia bacterium]
MRNVKKPKRPKTKVRRRGGAPSARVPLPAQRPARHGDATKYDRAREKERLAREIRRPEPDE